MEYNKYQYKKTNDKKILRKIGKQWKAVSVALLMAIGGTAVATHVSHASANTNNQNGNTNQITNDQSNHQQTTLIINTPKVNTANNNNGSKQSSNVSSQNITQKANDLHKNILLNSVSKQSQSSEAPVSSESKVNSLASSNVNQSASSATNEISPKVNNVGDQQNTNSDITYGIYGGMNYKYNKQNKSIEFTNGVMKNGITFGTGFYNGNIPIPYYPSDETKSINYSINAPKFISEASSMKFDSNVDSSHVTDADWMFCNDSNLRSLVFPQGFGQNIKYAFSMFYANDMLKTLTLPRGFGQNITFALAMFNNERSLQSLTIPAGFGQKINEDDSSMFAGNNKLYLTIPNSKIRIPMMLNSDGSPRYPHDLAGTWVVSDLKPATSNVANTISYHDIYSDIDGMSNPANKTVSGNVNSTYSYSSKDIPQGYALVNSDGRIINPTGSFTFNSDNTNHLLNVAPVYAGMTYKYNKENNSVEFVNGTMQNNAKFGYNFYNKPTIFNAKSIIFDNDINTSNVTDASDMFHDDYLYSLTLPKGFGKNITNADNMFRDASNLHSLALPKGFGKNIINANGMFGNTSLHSLALPRGFGKNIIKAGYMFMYTSLQSLFMPSNFGENINNALGMFMDNYKLYSLNLPKGFGKNITNAYTMFSGDTNLHSLTLPQGFGGKIHRAFQMFSFDSKLQLLTLPQGFGTNSSFMLDGGNGTLRNPYILMFDSVPSLYLKDNNDDYTTLSLIKIIRMNRGHSCNLGGTWVAKRNPKPTVINPYNDIYHDSYIANQDINAIKADMNNDTKYADLDAFNALRSDGEQVASDQFYIEGDLLNNNMSTLDDANQQISLANSAVGNASSLYNGVKSVETAKYNTIYNKSYNAYYDASVASNDANENIIQNNASASAQVSNDAMMINSARSAINTDYATYNVSSANTEDSIAQNALNNANTLYQSMSNDNYSIIYNAYYNASYAASATNKVIDNNKVMYNSSSFPNLAKDTSMESSAMASIMHDLSVNDAFAANDANSEEKVAHNAWTDINNIIYNANNRNSNTIYYVTYVDNNGNTVLHKAIRSLNRAKQFVPFGYSFNKIANLSVVNGKHVMTIDVISEF